MQQSTYWQQESGLRFRTLASTVAQRLTFKQKLSESNEPVAVAKPKPLEASKGHTKTVK
jgi:hypothetical protein